MVVVILVIAALILVNAVYVAAEFAAVSVRRSRIQQLAADGNVLASWLLPVLDSPAALDRYIAACQIGITLSSLVLGAYAQATIARALAPLLAALGGFSEVAAQSTSAVVVLLTLTVGQVIFAELVPKSLALQYPTQTALYTLVPMLPSLWVYRPFINWLNGTGLAGPAAAGGRRSSRTATSIRRRKSSCSSPRAATADCSSPTSTSRLQRALRLNLRQAKQLMVPRRRIMALDIDTPLNEVIAAVAQSPYSRLPVYRDSIDNVVGMLHTKDLVRWLVGDGGQATLATLIRPIASVHESVTADRVLRQLRERRTHQALVVDEFGGTAGLLTLEDVLSELLGRRRRRVQAASSCQRAVARRPDSAAGRHGGRRCGRRTRDDLGDRRDDGRRPGHRGARPPSSARRARGRSATTKFEVERVAERAVESVLARRLPQSSAKEDA